MAATRKGNRSIPVNEAGCNYCVFV